MKWKSEVLRISNEAGMGDYALTDSQGQTPQKIAVDLGSGAFAHGQVYVALSRCPSLDGVTLSLPLRTTDFCFTRES